MPLQEERKEFVAFLFDADHSFFLDPKEYNYAHSSEQRFLEAIALSPENKDCKFRIVRGDVLMHEVASTLQRFTRNASQGRESKSYGTDRRRLATAIGDVVDSFSGSWCTVDLNNLPVRLGSTNVFCLSSFPISLELAKSADNHLRSFTPYLGAIQLDYGNPLHITLFRNLLDCVFFSDKKIYLSGYDTDEGYYEFGQRPEDFFQVEKLKYWEFKKQAPKFPTNISLSDRGSTTVQRVGSVLASTHFENVAAELDRTRNHLNFDFHLLPPDVDQLFIPVDKLLKYSLNTEHEKGKHKARLFSDLLGISSAEWRYLAYQLAAGLATAKIENLRINEHGIQHSARIPVIGINGKSVTVQTGWIIRNGAPTQLTTAYPAEKAQQLASAGIQPPWVKNSVKGSARWEAIHAAASFSGEKSYKACIPTPMKIEGSPIILEGKCGHAWIQIDGRLSFAKWLVKNGHASSEFGPGIHISAKGYSQSIERAIAYAKEYAYVLWLNGIEAKFDSALS